MVAAAHGRGDQEQDSLELINLSETKVSDLGSGREERRDVVWRKENKMEGKEAHRMEGRGKRKRKPKRKSKKRN